MAEHGVILLAEDREDDIFLMRRAFSQANIINPIFVVRDGEETISYLKGEGKFSNRDEYPLPALLLLDLKMPRKNGFEVLQWIRAQPGLSALRVIVLTSSDQIWDVNRAYTLGANSFLVKPYDFMDLAAMMQTIRNDWILLSRAPETSRGPKTEDKPKPKQ
jgi:CheY-like chemotaxis protein